VGAASGGLWESSDAGATWRAHDLSTLPVLGISDISIAPSNHSVIYAATGDAEGSSVNSVGILLSTDGGTSWKLTGLKLQAADYTTIGRLLVHPTDPAIVIAAGSNSIWKTTNSGTNWTKVATGRFKDMEFKPGDPNILTAALSPDYPSTTASIFRSTDAGSNWTKVKDVVGTARIALAVTPADRNLVYAISDRSGGGGMRAIHRSTDGGATWKDIVPSINLLGREYDGTDSIGQGWYDLSIAVSPTNSHEIYVGGINVWRSTNDGNDWSMVGFWADPTAIHADHHMMLFSSDGKTVYSADDGGLNSTTDAGVTWKKLSNGLSITQYYDLSISQTDPNLLYAGAQDNGTHRYNGLTWSLASGGDGMKSAIDPTNNSIIYVSYPSGEIYRTGDGGSSYDQFSSPSMHGEYGAWLTPYVLHPTVSGTVYVGYVNVWKTTDAGSNWKKVSNFTGSALTALAIAPSDPQVLYAYDGTDLYRTTNGGTGWQSIKTTGGSDWPQITAIAVDANDARHIWVTRASFLAGSKVQEYNGTTWTDISGNLPNVPISCIVYQKTGAGRLYVGTDLGVYQADRGSSVWQPFGSELPNVLVHDLEIQYTTGRIKAATYGRGVWEASLNNCPALTLNVTTTDGKVSFCKGDSLILDAGAGYTSYSWSNGARTRTIKVDSSGTFTAVATDTAGCSYISKPIKVTRVAWPATPTITRKTDTLTSSVASSYQWNLDGVAIPGATARTYIVKKSGAYTVTVRNSGGCASSSAVTQMNVLGVDAERAARSISIYPTPGPGLFSIEAEFTHPVDLELTVSDASGATLFESQEGIVSGPWRRQIDLQRLPAGAYFLHLKTGAEESVHKIIKQ
jgi:photosystem II stability/assembly factor-like uncharacterized protein